MKKKILGIAVAMVMLFAAAGLAACNPTLAEYQTTARVDLTNYAQSRGQTNFTTDNWAVIQGHVTTGKAAIDAAETKPAVRIARDEAKANIGAVPQNGGASMLNAETINQIKQAAMTFVFQNSPQLSIDELFFFYYGTFNGSIVIMVHHMQTAWPRIVSWDAFKMIYPNSVRFIQESEWNNYDFQSSEIIAIRYPVVGQYILVWYDGCFFRLSEAHKQGLLTAEDLEQIAEIHYNEVDNVYRNNGTWH